MPSRKSAIPKKRSDAERRNDSTITVDLDEIELRYSRSRLLSGRRHGRDEKKRDDGDGIRRDDDTL